MSHQITIPGNVTRIATTKAFIVFLWNLPADKSFQVSVTDYEPSRTITKNQDIDHIKQMYGFLKEGGRMVSVASRSWMTGSQKKQVAFREWLDEVDAGIYELEGGEFKESGTSIAAVVIVIDKAA